MSHQIFFYFLKIIIQPLFSIASFFANITEKVRNKIDTTPALRWSNVFNWKCFKFVNNFKCFFEANFWKRFWIFDRDGRIKIHIDSIETTIWNTSRLFRFLKFIQSIFNDRRFVSPKKCEKLDVITLIEKIRKLKWDV